MATNKAIGQPIFFATTELCVSVQISGYQLNHWPAETKIRQPQKNGKSITIDNKNI